LFYLILNYQIYFIYFIIYYKNQTSDGPDGSTTVCCHPSVDILQKHAKPIPRPDPVRDNEETQDAVLKTRSEEKSEHSVPGPTTEQLSKMSFNTKRHWNPHGQNHRP
uniref:Large ribosomal subunit protein mL42 n=1 Tax=Moschus moschiferus TaxID=68415 RepID=A0A8C6G281_MOSMO